MVNAKPALSDPAFVFVSIDPILKNSKNKYMEALPVLGVTAKEQYSNKENLCPGVKSQDVKFRAAGQKWANNYAKKPLIDYFTKQVTPLYCKDGGCETSSQESGDIDMNKEKTPSSPGSSCDFDVWTNSEFTIFIDV